MCSEYLIRGNARKALRKAGVPVTEDREDEILERHIRLFSLAPIAIMRNSKVVFEDLSFSLRPKDLPFSTHNARLESWDEKKKKIVSIYEKPTWKNSFIRSRCLIPMSAFVEPIYVGDHAGEMIEFHDKSNEMLFAAGIYATSTNKETGEVYEGYALIMGPPSDFVLKAGHHRQPVLLKPSAYKAWLSEEEIDPEWGLEFLKKNRLMPALKVELNRKMAKGWEKRVSANQAKHKEELKFLTKVK